MNSDDELERVEQKFSRLGLENLIPPEEKKTTKRTPIKQPPKENPEEMRAAAYESESEYEQET